MKVIYILLLPVFFLWINSCKSIEWVGTSGRTEFKTAAITPNRSSVTVLVSHIRKLSDNDFVLTGKIVASEDMPGNPNLATIGEVINFKPNYYLNEENKINSDEIRNTKIQSLQELNPSATVNLIVGYNSKSGWLIFDVN
jgi:hypothetical protein